MKRSLMFGMILAVFHLGISGTSVWADSFDEYTLPIVSQVAGRAEIQEIKELTRDHLVQYSQVLPTIEGSMIFIATNQDRWAKLIVSAARHKIASQEGGEAILVPVIRLERFVTFREGSERSEQASGRGISLFAGFRFHFDMGQVVPDSLGGDVVVMPGTNQELTLKPVGRARMFLLTKPIPEAAPRGIRRLESGEKFDPQYFAGTYRLQEDGRKSGTLRLTLGTNNDIVGTFVSDQNGREYPVQGSVGQPNYKIQFVIQFPQTQQEFTGFMFTGNGKAIAGFSKMQERESGFYALRIEEQGKNP
jgi:hypothetical protein